MASSRTVSIILTAQVQNYLASFKAAEDATRQLDARTKTMTESLRAQQQQLVKHHEAMAKVGVGMVAVGTVAAAGLALAIKASAEFGAKMAQLQSLSHASAATMKQAADAAMTVGTAYGFTASQVADAQIELQKAGIGVQAQLGGALKGALTLAAAGQMDVSRATEITTVAMTQFGLTAGQVPHVADLLAAGADKALGSVDDLGEALKNGGLQAANMGLSIDQTVGLLSAFANAGILGAEAGTQMRSMFLRLENPTATAQKTLEKYGIAINDASGHFVGMTKFAGELHDQLVKQEPATRNAALATVFGSHAIVGATAIYNLGASGVQGWNDRVNEAGFAAAQAAGKMNSLQGDTQKLAAAFQTDLIKAGSGANDALRALTQNATGLLTVFGEIPAPLQDVAVTGAALTAGIGLLGGGFLIAVPKIAAFKVALTELGLSVKGTIGNFGALSGMVAGMALLMAMEQKAGETATANTQQVTAASKAVQDHLRHVNDLFKGNALVGAGIRNAFEEETSGEAANNKGLDVFGTHIGDVYRSHEAQLSALGSQLAGLSKIDYVQATSGFSKLVSLVGAAGDKAKQLQLVSLLGPDFQHQLSAVAKGIGVADTATNRLAIASGKGAIGQKALTYETAQAAAAAVKQATGLAKLTGSGEAATASVKSLHDALASLGKTELDAHAAARAFQQAIDDATAAIAKNGRTANKAGTDLDIHTQKGRDNQTALDGVASSARDSAAAYVANGGSAKGAAAIIADGRQKYIDTAHAMGVTAAGAAQKLADKMHLIPNVIRAAVELQKVEEAKAKLADLQSKLDALHGRTLTVKVAAEIDMTNSQIRVASMAASGVDYFGNPVRKAGGGSIDGRGPKGVDSVPAVLAPGEHVLTDKDVDAMGGQAGVYAFRASLHMAAGGAVGDAERAVARYHRAVAAARTKDSRDAAQQRLTDAESRLDSLRHDREDFTSAERRSGWARTTTDPLGYVDELRQMSRDTNYTSGRRRTFDATANRYETALTKLAAASEKATTKLNDLRQSSAQLHDAVSASIAGRYTLAGAGAQQTAGGWITRDGMRLQTTTTGYTAASIASYYTAGGRSAGTFAGQLAQLAKRGLNAALLAQLAQEADGPALASALLSGSSAQLAQVNAGYKSIASAAGRAGTTVADDTYKGQIAAAKRNADQITTQLRTDGEKLRHLIASAFGLKGYATGTTSAAAGIRWVGEDGPELVGFRGGEAVLNRSDSARWVRGPAGSSSGTAGGQPVVVNVAPFPDTITVADASGFTGTMRVIAHQVVSQRNDEIAVRVMGAMG